MRDYRNSRPFYLKQVGPYQWELWWTAPGSPLDRLLFTVNAHREPEHLVDLLNSYGDPDRAPKPITPEAVPND